jgi:hypothetical protein
MNKVLTMVFWLLVLAIFFESNLTAADDSDNSLTLSQADRCREIINAVK